jgi:hypothetical protein
MRDLLLQHGEDAGGRFVALGAGGDGADPDEHAVAIDEGKLPDEADDDEHGA